MIDYLLGADIYCPYCQSHEGNADDWFAGEDCTGIIHDCENCGQKFTLEVEFTPEYWVVYDKPQPPEEAE